MVNICLLTFTRNDFDVAVDKVRRYYGFFDLFIIIDSSSVSPPDLGFGGVVVFRAPALGYADPLHQFGVRRAVELGCDWVVRLDVDEELSEDLLRDLRGILENSSCDAYSIAFYVYGLIPNHVVYDGEKPRIFKPSKAYHNGVIHESEPQINGKTCKLNPTKYHIKHTQETPFFKDYERQKRYAEIESYERPLTVNIIVARALRYLLHFMEGTLPDRLISVIMSVLPSTLLPSWAFKLYNTFRTTILRQRLGFKNWDQHRLISNINVLNPYFRYVYGYMRTLNSKELVLRSSIAMDIIRAGGVTKYLCLDKDDVVQELTKVAEHIEGFGGVSFFTLLLRLRYIVGDCSYINKLRKLLNV